MLQKKKKIIGTERVKPLLSLIRSEEMWTCLNFKTYETLLPLVTSYLQ